MSEVWESGIYHKSMLLCVPPGKVQHDLQRWPLINIPRKKKKIKGNQKKKTLHELQLPSVYVLILIDCWIKK